MVRLDISKARILAAATAWWLLFLGLSFWGYNRFELQNIVGFLFLALVPGTLTLLCIRLKGLPFWGYVTTAVGFSLLELMLTGLLTNAILPLFGIDQPLAKIPLLGGISVLIVALITVGAFKIEGISAVIKKYVIFDSLKDAAFSLVPVAFVALSIAGAISLNNNGSNIWTMILLGSISAFLAVMIYFSPKLEDKTIPWVIFLIALSLLLMTSLRGWYITGHDIQSEYKVFALSKNANLWDVATYKDAYNACLSITILPTMLYNLLKVSDPYIYKILFQIFFALCPCLVYLMSRHWTGKRIALLSTIFFIGFPTFFTDMPFLVRQETAFLFYGLMLYLIFEERVPLMTRRALFVIMGIGVILSHYSTTYTVLVVFGLAAGSRPVFMWLADRYKSRSLFKRSSLIPRAEERARKHGKVTLPMVILLFVLSFVWTSLITDTGGHLNKVIQQTASAIGDGFSGNNRSIDVATLLSFHKPSQKVEMEAYVKNVVGQVRASASSTEFFAERTYDQYPYTVLSVEKVPLSPLGQALKDHGVDMPLLVYYFGQLLQKLMELLVPLGMLYILIGRPLTKHVDSEIYLISFYCLVFVALNIILPILSTAYGIFRALQQSMFIIAPVIVIGSAMIGSGIIKAMGPFGKKISFEAFPSVLTALFFFYSSYFMPYLFGGNPAILHLSNYGSYYDSYLIQASEVYGVEWMQAISDKLEGSNGVRIAIQADRYSEWKFASLTALDASNDIFPGVIRKNGYVFIEPTVAAKKRATAIYNSDPVTYAYPMEFLENNKDLIYNNTGSKVYK